MSSEEGLLRAVQADPDDELPRLLLADWLDDTGDTARAEFVRVQCELARGVANLAQREELQERERRLLFENAECWLGPFARTKPPVWRYERGTAIITMQAAAFLQPETRAAAEWFPRGWVMEVRLQGTVPNLPDLFSQKWLGRLTRLRLDGAALHSAGMGLLCDCALLGRLRSLTLADAKANGEFGRLAQSPHLAQLAALDLSRNNLTTADVMSLGKGLPGLWRLNLSGNALSRAHLEKLLDAPWLDDLTGLQLSNCQLTPDILKPLVSSPRLASLEELNLSHNYLYGTVGEMIAASPHLANLRRLGLRRTSIGGAGATALAASPHLKALEMLDIWDSGVGRGSLEKLRDRFGKSFWFRLEEPPCWG